MNVIMPMRLKPDEAKKIKDFAKENKTSMSAMLTYKIRQYVIGDLAFVQPPPQPEVKQTSAVIPVEDMAAFKDLVKKTGLPMDEAIRQLTACLISDLNQNDQA